MNPQITNLAIILGMMQVTKRIPFENPDVLNAVRAMYIISNVIIISLYLMCGKKIKQKNDQTTLKYLEPGSPMSGDTSEKLVTTTVQEYDQSQLKSALKGVLMGVAMMAGMHLYMKYTNPLVIQSIIPLKTALESKLVQVHIFGKPASGDLKRPWKVQGFMQPGDVKTDKRSTEKIEASGAGGVKEE